jgi:ABC-type amino acid transport substrate-binding protein
MSHIATRILWGSWRFVGYVLLVGLFTIECGIGAQATQEVAPNSAGAAQFSPEHMGQPGFQGAPKKNDVHFDGHGNQLAEHQVADHQPAVMPNTEIPRALVIACDRNNPPYTMLYPDGSPAGMFIDLWRLWAKKSGTQVQFGFNDLADSIASVPRGEADLHSGIFATEDRNAYMDFSQPFYETSSSIFFAAKFGQVSAAEDLQGQRIGAIEGGASAAYLREHLPEIQVVTYKDPRKMIDSAIAGEINAIASETLDSYLFTLRVHLSLC